MPRNAWLAVALAAVVAVYFVILYVAQRSMLFPIPMRESVDHGDGAELVRIAGTARETHAIFLPPRQDVGRAPLLMFTHGNGELASDWVPEFEPPVAWGMAVLLVEYPGYGGAPGSPSETSIRAAMKAAYDWATAHPRIDSSRIIVYGRSLGAGAAALLATERPVAALVLESPFTSVADFAARMLAPSFLVRDRFDSYAALSRYRGPLLVIHGRYDTIVPIAHGRTLASLVPDAQLVELDCGHNDCPRQWAAIRAFLDR